MFRRYETRVRARDIIVGSNKKPGTDPARPAGVVYFRFSSSFGASNARRCQRETDSPIFDRFVCPKRTYSGARGRRNASRRIVYKSSDAVCRSWPCVENRRVIIRAIAILFRRTRTSSFLFCRRKRRYARDDVLIALVVFVIPVREYKCTVALRTIREANETTISPLNGFIVYDSPLFCCSSYSSQSLNVTVSVY